MTKLFNFEFTIEHEEMTKAEKEKAEDKLEAVFNEIFGDEWVGSWTWDYKPEDKHVIRCKDCAYYVIDELKRDGTEDRRYSPSVCIARFRGEKHDPDWYCADAERRGEE